ncbi:MAG: enoyl-CoA hydratase [Rhizobiales bacterium]|mgnify:CR=1 FL=1|nr:enoyl-CoA hydratase [Hyphomicrobiales bacterium]MBG18568.1 enoyl-CoA hydratase [Hyphomicrobiales bacterium]
MTGSIKFADGFISADIANGKGRLVLDRPTRKNAISRAMWLAIPEAVAWLARGGARVIVLSGGGTADFSAGADISEFDAVRKDAGSARDYERSNCAAFAALRNAPVPVIAAIRGICFGGAFGLASACDLRVADTSARFAIPAGRLGLAYPAEAVADLVAALGAQRARHLMMTASEVDSASAFSGGFLLESVAPDQLDTAVNELAERISAAAPLSVAASRKAVRAALSGSDEDRAAAEEMGDATFESADYAEGRAAFREKRRPVFTGQ